MNWALFCPSSQSECLRCQIWSLREFVALPSPIDAVVPLVRRLILSSMVAITSLQLTLRSTRHLALHQVIYTCCIVVHCAPMRRSASAHLVAGIVSNLLSQAVLNYARKWNWSYSDDLMEHCYVLLPVDFC